MQRLTTARYGRMRQRGLFTVQTVEEIVAGDVCVVRTPRGHELGTILATPIEQGEGAAGCGESACGSCATAQGEVLRIASREDRSAHRDMEVVGNRREIEYTRRRARELGLAMKVCDAEYLLRREKLIIHFASESRVDFRDLVRDLAREFKTRIELRQIGARDEARLVGDMASCGRELCCRSFLHDLQPVSMRMAKLQKKTLDPNKISGQCGKLKCCLRYEDSVYTELQKTLPRRGGWVRLKSGLAKVLDVDVLLQKVVVDLKDGNRQIVHTSELIEARARPPGAPMEPLDGDDLDFGEEEERPGVIPLEDPGSPSGQVTGAAQAAPPTLIGLKKVQPLKLPPSLRPGRPERAPMRERDDPPGNAKRSADLSKPDPGAPPPSQFDRRRRRGPQR